jgi:DNA mismatch repair ATPase MutS
MIELDILFIQDNEAKLSAGYFSDMGLECLKKIITDKEYDVFVDTVCSPLNRVDIIKERQNILEDFLNYPGFILDLQKICLNAQNNKFITYSMVYGGVTPKRKLTDNLQIINKSLDVPIELLNIMRYKDFSSKTFSDFYEKLNRIELLSEIKMKINEIIGWLLNDCVTFDVEYGLDFKLVSSHISAEGNCSLQPKSRFSKNKRTKLDTCEFVYNLDFLLNLQIENLMERGVLNMYSVISAINYHILNFCGKLTRQLLFYSAAIKIVNFSKLIGCNIIYPQFQSKVIKAKALYDFGLLVAYRSDKEIIPNDFLEENDEFFIISGANQGGKTTFLKSIGIAQLFSQNGLPVFAKEYDCPVYKSIISHFPNDEDEALSHGKLAEEMTRFHDTLPLMKDNALVLLNESFATTTEKEGYEIIIDVLKALSKVRPSLFFVTHNFELLKNMQKVSMMLENNVHLRSLIAYPGSSSIDRTYTIIPGEPQDEIFGLDYIMKCSKLWSNIVS